MKMYKEIEKRNKPIEQKSKSNEDTEEIRVADVNDISFVDLYIFGKIWIELLKAGLIGTKLNVPSIIPVVKAMPVVKAEEIVYTDKNRPSKPSKMKYKDLPLDACPHYAYQEYMLSEERSKCPQAKDKIIHEYLLPTVKAYRKWALDNVCEVIHEFKLMKKGACNTINSNKTDFINYMRDPNNMSVRRAVVAFGGLTGYYIGSGKGLSRRFFFTSAGLLAAGALCFPEDTDENFRSIAFTSSKILIGVYNFYCKKCFSLRERVPCKSDIPPPLPPRKDNACPGSRSRTLFSGK